MKLFAQQSFANEIADSMESGIDDVYEQTESSYNSKEQAVNHLETVHAQLEELGLFSYADAIKIFIVHANKEEGSLGDKKHKKIHKKIRKGLKELVDNNWPKNPGKNKNERDTWRMYGYNGEDSNDAFDKEAPGKVENIVADSWEDED